MKSMVLSQQLKNLIAVLLSIVSLSLILVFIVWYGINPERTSAQGRNQLRRLHLNKIHAAISRYSLEHDGLLPPTLTMNPELHQIGTCHDHGDNYCSNASKQCLDLVSDLKPYLPTLPVDPLIGSSVFSAYSVNIDAHDLITLTACGGELGQIISVTR